MRRKKQRSVDLDLTSFLDVLFIILIAYMIVFTGKRTESNPTPMPISPGPEDYTTLSLEIFYDELEVKNRTIIFKNAETDEPLLEFGEYLSPETEKEQYDKLREKINEIIQENEETPVLLCMYQDRILYRDYEKVVEITDSIKNETRNLYPIWKKAVYEEDNLGEDDAE